MLTLAPEGGRVNCNTCLKVWAEFPRVAAGWGLLVNLSLMFNIGSSFNYLKLRLKSTNIQAYVINGGRMTAFAKTPNGIHTPPGAPEEMLFVVVVPAHVGSAPGYPWLDQHRILTGRESKRNLTLSYQEREIFYVGLQLT